jgi:HK97 family phage major capsid protein
MKTKNKPKAEQPDLMIRAAFVDVRVAEGDAPAQVRMSVSSEEPVLTYCDVNGQWMRCYEILDHGPNSVDMTRMNDGLVILDRHYGDQIGLMRAEVKDRKIGGAVEFCTGARAQEIAADSAKGLRRNVSVGYVVRSDSYRIEGDKDGIPVVRAMSWMPYEASFEPVPADTTVGVNRAAQTMTAEKPAKEDAMDPKEMAKLFERAAKFGIGADVVSALVADGKGRAELDSLIVEKQGQEVAQRDAEIVTLKARKPDAPPAKTVQPIGGSVETEAQVLRKYSVLNVCRSLAGMKADVGFEREISEECAKQRGKPAEGIIIPFNALMKRDFTVAGTSSASVATQLQSGQFIDLLRTEYVLGRLGVQFLTGLVGDIAIPKMSAGATGYWVAEGGDITESQPTLGQVTGTPHTAGALVDISRKLMIQSTPSAEEMVRNEIVERVLRTIQIAVFAGTGADGQPSAITNATGINNPSVTTGTPTYAELLGFPGAIMADSAMADAMKWAMTAEVWAKLAATATNGAGSPLALNPDTGRLAGYGYEVTEDLPANSLWFGNWRSVVVGIWGNGVDVAMTDSKLFASGGVTLRALQDVDVMVRLGQALAYNTTVTS